ncbi:hypothetical protein P4S75_04950 [Anoxybacillus ayderensis]|uniref:hypothetical protein n=1 Tax=Anoxybacillus ayderensis TaxID=265546 RepID=UPI002E209B81|nr:hypothetical protein [Anoxybacillus ayderensis]
MIEAFVSEVVKKELNDLSFKELPTFVKYFPVNEVLDYTEADKPLYEQEFSREDIIEFNRLSGDLREMEVYDRLQEKYPEQGGYKTLSEVYLRDESGNIVRDDVTGQARRIDFVIVKDGQVVESIEVTSKTAPKEEQMAKEGRIRDIGGNHIKDQETGELYYFPLEVQTRVWRLE